MRHKLSNTEKRGLQDQWAQEQEDIKRTRKASCGCCGAPATSASLQKGDLDQCDKHKRYWESYMRGISWEQFAQMYTVEKTGVTLDKAFENRSKSTGPHFTPEHVHTGQTFVQRLQVKYTTATMKDLKESVKEQYDFDLNQRLLAGIPTVTSTDPRTDQITDFYP